MRVGLQKGPGEPRSSDYITGESIKAVLFCKEVKSLSLTKIRGLKILPFSKLFKDEICGT